MNFSAYSWVLLRETGVSKTSKTHCLVEVFYWGGLHASCDYFADFVEADVDLFRMNRSRPHGASVSAVEKYIAWTYVLITLGFEPHFLLAIFLNSEFRDSTFILVFLAMISVDQPSI